MAEKEEANQEDAPKKGGAMMAMIKAVVFVGVIVVVEVVGASMMIPSAADTEKLAEQLAKAELGTEGQTDEEMSDEVDEENPENAIREIEIGSYPVMRFNPASGTTMTIDVTLYAAVLASDEEDFTTRLSSSAGRVGEQVVLTLRNAEMADLADASLGLIKRQILEKTNRALGKPIVREILFTKFNFVER